MTQAEAGASPDMRLHWRAATAIFVVGVVAAGFGFGAGGGAQARGMALSPEAPPSTTTSTAPAPPAGVDLATSEIPPEENAPAASVPSNPEPGPNAASPTPTPTATTPRPARTAPKPTTTTTAPGTIESRGAAALALIDYPWKRTGYSIVFAGPNPNLLGLTEPSRKQITIYLRPTQSTADITHVLGHEIAHAVDFTMTTDAERAEYRRIRGLDDDTPWYPTCGLCPDYRFPVGDWAETFAYWLLGGSFNSQLGGRPTPAQLAALKPIFAADAAAAPTTTTTRPSATSPAPKPTTTPTTAGQGGTAPVYWYWYWYGGATAVADPRNPRIDHAGGVIPGPTPGRFFRHRSPSPATTLSAWALVGAQGALIGGLIFWSPPADWSVPRALETAGSLLRTFGLVWMALAAISLGRSISPLPLPLERGGLRTGGLYRLSRHPIYTGLIAFAFGSALRAGSIGKVLVAATLTLLLAVKARFEEDHLRTAYPAYRNYQARTPRFFPTGRRIN